MRVGSGDSSKLERVKAQLNVCWQIESRGPNDSPGIKATVLGVIGVMNVSNSHDTYNTDYLSYQNANSKSIIKEGLLKVCMESSDAN